jgi:NAD(P)-dependent dehydrogenase (short-subunit alcohol dehydrogenase family)
MDYFNVKGKVVVVTGGSSGIGYGLAKVFAKAESKLVLVNRNKETGKKAVESLREIGADAISIPTNVRCKDEVVEMFKKVKENYGKIDVLINAAGIIVRKLAVDMTEEDWNSQVDINLKGTFNCCSVVAVYMMEQRSGNIINISSDASKRVGIHTPAAYAATKAGIIQMSRVFSMEFIPYNINVNVIAPGFFETPMNEEFRSKNPDEYEEVKKQMPRGRAGNVIEDLGGVCIFLASKACQHMVGQVLYVDGGYTVGEGRWNIPEGRIAGS